MASDYGFRFTKEAEKELDEIFRYFSEELSNPTAAENFYNAFTEALAEVRKFPFSGLLVNNEFALSDKVRRVAVKKYIMYYLPDEKEHIITVLQIIYGKRDLNTILRELKYLQ